MLLGRSQEKAQPVLDAIRAVDASVPAKFVEVDLCSHASVRAAAAKILADPDVPHINALINNAAVMACPYALSSDGIELQFAAGHVGHFLLTNLLMPKLLRGGARIVNVSSMGHKLGHVRFDDPNFTEEGSYTPWNGYGQAKTANILFSVALNNRFAGAAGGGIHAYALHPGSITTNLGKHLKPGMIDSIKAQVLGSEFATFRMKNLQQGCSTQLRAALDPSLPDQEGVMLYSCALTTNPEKIFPRAVDPADAERLWTLSEKLVGQEFKY